MTSDHCRSCTKACWMLRRIGFRDDFSWGTLGGPTVTVHAFHANSGSPVIAEYRTEGSRVVRRVVDAIPGTTPDGTRYVTEKGPVAPMCSAYRSELAWLSAGRTARIAVYLAHPLSGGDFAENLANAHRWLQYLRSRSSGQLSELTGVHYERRPVIHAPWIAVADPALDMDPDSREAIIDECMATASLFDEVWWVGGRTTSGMQREASAVPTTRNLTHLGYYVPGMEPRCASGKQSDGASGKHPQSKRKR